MEAVKSNTGNGAEEPIALLDVRTQIKLLLDAKEVSQADVAREAGISGSAVSRWLKNEYPGDNAAVEEKLRRWLEARARQTEFTLPEGPDYVATRVAERVVAVLSYGQMAADLVVVYGPPGIGKSRGIRRYQATRPNVFTATMNAATASICGCLKQVLYALGHKETRGLGAADMQRYAVQRVLNTRGLLVIDEAQHLTHGALETLRAIHDEAEIGLALVGNEHVFTRLTGNGKGALFAQLFSRIGRREALRRPSKADVHALAEGWGVGAADALQFLDGIAGQPGSLRGVTKTLRLAASYASSAGEALTTGHLKHAWRELGGESRQGGES